MLGALALNAQLITNPTEVSEQPIAEGPCVRLFDDIREASSSDEAIEGVALTDDTRSRVVLVFADNGTRDPEYWDPIIQGLEIANVERTASGYASENTAGGVIDFWNAAYDAVRSS